MIPPQPAIGAKVEMNDTTAMSLKDRSESVAATPAKEPVPRKPRARRKVTEPVAAVPAITADRRKALGRLLATFSLSGNEAIWKRLNRALIHRSHRAEAGLAEDNERLEFLGDSVIGLACTEYLLRLHPDVDEGLLSKLRAATVSRAVLGELAQQLGIGDLLLLGTGEEKSGGRARASILGSALEAVCGALYLCYPWEQIREPIWKQIIVPALGMIRQDHLIDYKSRLQEWSQRGHQQVPSYRVVGEGGPDHSKVFEVEVLVGEKVLGKGAGKRKKQAENSAARIALQKIIESEEV